MTATTSPQLTKDRVFGLIQGYRNTSLLRTGIRLGVFDCLDEGPAAAADVAERLRIDPRGALILLNGLVAIGVLQVDGEAFSLVSGADEWLVSSSAGSVANLVHVLASDWEWDALKVLDDAVRCGGTVVDEQAETPGFRYWADFATYATAATEPTANLIVDELAEWMAARPSVAVLDVACGHGLYGYTLAAREPSARVWSLDWPHVLEIAADHAERLHVRDRVEQIAGDMFTTPLAGPYDLVLVTNVLHHFSEERATELLSRAAGVLKPDGKLVVVGFTLTDEPPDRDPAPYLFSILMLAWTTAGEVHTEHAYDRMFRKAGFTVAEVHRLPNIPMRVLVADLAHSS